MPKIIVKNVGEDRTWKEDIGDEENKPRSVDQQDWEAMTTLEKGECVVQYWNSTLRPHDKARQLVGIA